VSIWNESNTVEKKHKLCPYTTDQNNYVGYVFPSNLLQYNIILTLIRYKTLALQPFAAKFYPA